MSSSAQLGAIAANERAATMERRVAAIERRLAELEAVGRSFTITAASSDRPCGITVPDKPFGVTVPTWLDAPDADDRKPGP